MIDGRRGGSVSFFRIGVFGGMSSGGLEEGMVIRRLHMDHPDDKVIQIFSEKI